MRAPDGVVYPMTGVILETQFGGHQKDFGKLYPHFHEEMSGLRSEIGKLTDTEIMLRRPGRPQQPALEPDIRAVRSLEDALAGRDPALDAALRP